MNVLIEHDRCVLLHGDCADLGEVLEDESVDAIVTDPPAGISFMSKDWDGDKGGRDDLPSGFGPWLAGLCDGEANFDIHKQTRNSGDYYYCRFEISLHADDGGLLAMLKQHLGGKVYYAEPSTSASPGSNPKVRWELVSRAECARLVNLFDRFPLQSKKARDFAIWREALAVSAANVGTSRPDLMEPFWHALRATRPYAGHVTDPVVFKIMQHEHRWVAWLADLLRPVLRALKPGGFAAVWAIPRTSHWTAWALELAGFEVIDVVHHLFGTGMPKSLDLARQIDMHLCTLRGRHCDKNLPKRRKEGDHLCPPHPRRVEANEMRTALKPAAEHWILARKSRRGTYAENVLEFGTGGLNIEACRPAYDPEIGPPAAVYSGAKGEASGQIYGASGKYESQVSEDGNWPPHVVLDEQAAWCVDAMSTDTKGGAARYFYCVKAPRSEKDEGLDYLPEKTGGAATGREEDSIGTQNPRAGAGRTGGARNHHPTVKSVALMRWLVRLVTPPGGVVLDPFAGSGTTGVAALAEGCRFIGCEQGGDDGEYLPIVEGRLRHALEETLK